MSHRFVVRDTAAITIGLEERAVRVEIPEDCPRAATIAALLKVNFLDDLVAVFGDDPHRDGQPDLDPAQFTVTAWGGEPGCWTVSDEHNVLVQVIREGTR